MNKLFAALLVGLFAGVFAIAAPAETVKRETKQNAHMVKSGVKSAAHSAKRTTKRGAHALKRSAKRTKRKVK